jgi:hypothetical protein
MYTEDSPLIVPSSASIEQAVACILSRAHDNYADDDISTTIVPTYFALCAGVGIDPILALAQMIHETQNPVHGGVSLRIHGHSASETRGLSYKLHRLPSTNVLVVRILRPTSPTLQASSSFSTSG